MIKFELWADNQSEGDEIHHEVLMKISSLTTCFYDFGSGMIVVKYNRACV